MAAKTDATDHEALVFVHGYNVSFKDAARRTAQIAYDLGFPGVALFYSWPSQSRVLAYTKDETSAEWTLPHLTKFLETLAANPSLSKIHLIAHSMGNRPLTRALLGIEDKQLLSKFETLILTAPDIDADVFRDQLARQLVKRMHHVILYASANDRALRLSERLHGYPRAGDGGSNIVIVNGLDTIDASAVDTDLVGHFYYGDNRSVLTDVADLVRGKALPRGTLREVQVPSGHYWVFPQ